MVLLAVISGLSSFFLISTINEIIGELLGSNTIDTNYYLLVFSIVVLIFFVSKRILAAQIIKLTQELYWNIRTDIIELVLKSSFEKIKPVKDEIYSVLTRDVGALTNASTWIIYFFTSAILILACLIYMVFLSWKLFLVFFTIAGFGIVLYLIVDKKNANKFLEVRNVERKFIRGFNSILDGIKEININPGIGRDISDKRLKKVVRIGKDKSVDAYVGYLNSQIISQLLFYIFIIFILLFSRSLFDLKLETAISYIFVTLYILEPIATIMTIIPVMTNAGISLKRITDLQDNLKQNEHDEQLNKKEAKSLALNFNSLSFKNYSFSYGEDKFEIGPIDFEIKKGDLVFIRGGNGAGKTTFINTILSLYSPKSGAVLLNGTKVIPAEISKLKNLFSPVFSDFYLFDDFYGIEKPDIEKANEYLKVFELTEKVQIVDKSFSTIDLSTGQRKRLALIYALLSARPILVLDEWAADQDPIFREKFYTEIIPMMVKEENKTIIAITHDDRYYHVADRILLMEYGKIKEINALNT